MVFKENNELAINLYKSKVSEWSGFPCSENILVQFKVIS